MKFKKIRVKNLRSYKDQEIIFPEGSLLLSGDVGSGKSSILLAIEYALFGLQPGQKGASLLRNNEQFSEVELELEIEGKSIILERRLKRTPKGVSNEYAAITIDGIKEESSLTEIKLKVVNLLGYPQEFVKKNNILYRYTVHSPQEQMKQIILEDSESRLNILRHVFGIDKYKQIKDNLLILLNNLKGDSKILQGEISTLEEEKEKLVLRKSSLEELEKIIKINELSFEEKIRLRKKLEEELLEAKKKIDEKASFEKEVDKTKILITTKREILISLDRELGEVKRIISESGEDFREDDNKALLDKINEEKKNFENTSTAYANFTSQISFLKKDSNSIVEKKERIFKIDICPTCLQDVPESHKHNILNDTEKNLSEIKKNIELLEKNQREAIERIESQKSNLATLEENKIKIEILKSKQ
jgi:DNA repair protein SbcC/Rad50